MRIRKKINIKIYLGFSIAIILFSLLLAQNIKEMLTIVSVYFAVIINQWLLVETVEDLVLGAADQKEVDKGQLVFMFITKAVILIAALTFGVQIMGNRIIIPIIIYVIQIFILYFSLNAKEKEKEKTDEKLF